MGTSSEELKKVMRGWASGVAIITCVDGDSRQGMTVSSFTSVSVDPPAITVSLANSTRSKQAIEMSGFFAINILPKTCQDLADRFAGRSGDQEDRFRGVDVKTGAHRLPILVCATAWLVCRVIHTYDFNESTLFVAEVMTCEKVNESAPLVYYDREYQELK